LSTSGMALLVSYALCAIDRDSPDKPRTEHGSYRFASIDGLLLNHLLVSHMAALPAGMPALSSRDVGPFAPPSTWSRSSPRRRLARSHGTRNIAQHLSIAHILSKAPPATLKMSGHEPTFVGFGGKGLAHASRDWQRFRLTSGDAPAGPRGGRVVPTRSVEIKSVCGTSRPARQSWRLSARNGRPETRC
jgi:hypothetical protein